ncbi:hypothetical protein [Yersinia enterocolitica]|uniref:hypothetical protein n=1 Tax=Yersinia enterocolitica TaxID=630 RepID=UPI003F43EB6B
MRHNILFFKYFYSTTFGFFSITSVALSTVSNVDSYIQYAFIFGVFGAFTTGYHAGLALIAEQLSMSKNARKRQKGRLFYNRLTGNNPSPVNLFIIAILYASAYFSFLVHHIFSNDAHFGWAIVLSLISLSLFICHQLKKLDSFTVSKNA